MYRRSLHCLASSRGAKTQNEISPLYIVGSDRVATLQSDKRIFFKTLGRHLHNPGILLATAHTSDPTSTHVPAGPTSHHNQASPTPRCRLPSSPLERMFDPRPHPISPFFRWPHHNPSPPTINHHPRLCAMSEARAVHHAIGQARPGARQRVGSHISKFFLVIETIAQRPVRPRAGCEPYVC